MTPNKTKPTLAQELLRLHAGGLLFVALLALLGGSSSYLNEAAKHAVSLRSIASYSAYLLAYASAVEVSLRLSQERLLRRGWERLGLILPAACYGLLHLHHSLSGFVYALLLGLFIAWRASVVRRWWWFVLWHIQWDLMAFAATILLALSTDGEARESLLFHYKSEQLQAGKLTYREGWGWVDKQHANPRELKYIQQQLTTGAAEIRLQTGFSDALGRKHLVKRRYHIHPYPESPQLRWAISAGIILDLAQVSEQAQEESPIWWGSQASAWQFDDLNSTLRMCLDHRPGALLSTNVLTDKERLSLLWLEEGRALVKKTLRSPSLPPGASDEERDALHRINTARAYWRSVADEI